MLIQTSECQDSHICNQFSWNHNGVRPDIQQWRLADPGISFSCARAACVPKHLLDIQCEIFQRNRFHLQSRLRHKAQGSVNAFGMLEMHFQPFKRPSYTARSCCMLSHIHKQHWIPMQPAMESPACSTITTDSIVFDLFIVLVQNQPLSNTATTTMMRSISPMSNQYQNEHNIDIAPIRMFWNSASLIIVSSSKPPQFCPEDTLGGWQLKSRRPVSLNTWIASKQPHRDCLEVPTMS